MKGCIKMGKFKDAVIPVMDKYAEEVKEIRKVYDDAINKTNRHSGYTQQYKLDVISELKQELTSTLRLLDEKYNNKLQEIIQTEKPSIVGDPKEKPADYQVQISNALKFIEMAGKNLSDDQAYEILKPFKGDHETMAIFKNAIVGVAGSLENRFENTFKDTNNYMKMMDQLKDVEGNAGKILNGFDNSYQGRLKVHLFKDSVDSIDQISESMNGEEE